MKTRTNDAAAVPKKSVSKPLLAFVPVLGWLPALAFLLYSVWIRIHDKYMKSILLASGRQGSESDAADIAFLFRQDLLWFGVVTPLVIVLAWHFGGKWIRRLVVTFTLLALLLLYANLQSWGQIGRFLNLSALIDGISFGIANPAVARYYISIKGLIKLAVVVVVTLAAFGFAGRLQRHRTYGHRIGAFALLLLIGCAGAAQLGYRSTLRDTPVTRSFMLNAAAALTGHSQDGDRFAKSKDEELDAAFERLAMHPRATQDPRPVGLERNSNLVLFVMETASIEFLDTRKPLPAHPVWAKLSASRHVGANHYSTFPASAESNFSILAGLYPPRAYYGTCMADRFADDTVPTLFGELRHRGVKTAVYLPYFSKVPLDKVVFEATGFGKVYYGQGRPQSKEIGSDRVALNEMISDVSEWGRAKQRFAVAYFPQTGHGPWSEAWGKTIADRGHAKVMRQLDWLESLVDAMASSGVLNDTVIVLTGDHGVRTTEEDPRVPVGMIDAYPLHVPLVIVAPHAGYSGQTSMAPTSHVDIPAELSHLLGVAPHPVGQGLPLQDPAIASRRQFFMANWYYGADGYRAPSESAMFNTELGVAYWRQDGLLDFGSANIVADLQKEARIRDTLSEMLDLQSEWIKRRVCQLPAALH